ncbi:interleukin-13 receptor subunit alpha-1-like [Nothobranchius furzeri]|uniref:Interleukin-13 receptor subunit alpha-1-like n=1 Tax=Nothobranchius furzeri TaxID=105023 RepID=A0A9D2XRZ3_NOTFU|nr:interleukin-13 receptor subunit alpha-1-like [Nothobranchius furzeri]
MSRMRAQLGSQLIPGVKRVIECAPAAIAARALPGRFFGAVRSLHPVCRSSAVIPGCFLSGFNMTAAQMIAALCCASALLARAFGAEHSIPRETPATYSKTWWWFHHVLLNQTLCVFIFQNAKTTQTYYSDDYLTEEVPSDWWELSVQTTTSCSGWNRSQPVIKTITRPKKRVELVKDFKCYIDSKSPNCSWIPVNPSTKVDVSYRYHGEKEEGFKGVQKCADAYWSHGRGGCFLKANSFLPVLVVAESPTGIASFEAKLVIGVTELSVKEEEGYLSLAWSLPAVGQMCTWTYCLWYKECNKDIPPQCYDIKGNDTKTIPYKKCCEYKIQYNLTTTAHCPKVTSDNSKVTSYGNTMPCIQTNMVAIVLPILFCFCVFLSIYCFNRNKDILCPKIPNHFEIKSLIRDKKPQTGIVMPEPVENTESVIAIPNKCLYEA